MKQFFIQLITANSGISSKRFLSLFAGLLLAVVVIGALFGKTVPDLIIYALVSIILGNSAMTLAQTKADSDTRTRTE